MNTPLAPARKSIAVAAALITGLFATSAFAVPVVINFSATLYSGLGTLASGSVINGSLTFDDAQLGALYSWGTYYNNFASSETIGSQTVINPFSYAQIADENSNYGGDLVALTVNYPSTGGAFSLGGLNDVSTGFQIWGMGNNIINNESLTSVAGLNLSNASTAWMYFYDGGVGENQGSMLAFAQLTSWQASGVPEESLTLALLGAGMAALLVLRRRFGRG